MSKKKDTAVEVVFKNRSFTNIILHNKKADETLNVDELACALYEGTPHLQNLAEKLARQHGKAGALSFYDMMGSPTRAFWRSIAKQLIEHSRHWLENEGSCCILDQQEQERLNKLTLQDGFE